MRLQVHWKEFEIYSKYHVKDGKGCLTFDPDDSTIEYLEQIVRRLKALRRVAKEEERKR